MSKKRDIEAEIKTMKTHLGALNTFVTTGGRDLNEFAKSFPRTWDALLIGDLGCFDLLNEETGTYTGELMELADHASEIIGGIVNAGPEVQGWLNDYKELLAIDDNPDRTAN